MLNQHQSPAAGTKGLDANKLTLFFAVRIQYDMDRIVRGVLYLLYDVGVPILCVDGFQWKRKEKSQNETLKTLNWEKKKHKGERKVEKIWRTLNTAFAPNLRISPWLRGDAVVTTLKPDDRAS